MFYVLGQPSCKSWLKVLTRAGKLKKISSLSVFPCSDVHLTPYHYLADLIRDSPLLKLRLVLIIQYSYKDMWIICTRDKCRWTSIYYSLFSSDFVSVYESRGSWCPFHCWGAAPTSKWCRKGCELGWTCNFKNCHKKVKKTFLDICRKTIMFLPPFPCCSKHIFVDEYNILIKELPTLCCSSLRCCDDHFYFF